MTFKSFWLFNFPAKNEQKAAKVLGWFTSAMGVEPLDVQTEKHHTAGYDVRFTVRHDAASWSDLVLEVIAAGQSIGYGWELTGSILDHPSGSCNRFSLCGASFASWLLEGGVDYAEPQPPMFRFTEKVIVTSWESGVQGQVGNICGRDLRKDGRWNYSVNIEEVDCMYYIEEENLQSAE